MPKRGPRRTSTDILQLRGSWRGASRAKTETKPPKTTRRAPPCPQSLTGDERKCWQHIVPLLNQAGLLEAIDRNALERYCINWSRWVAAARWLKEHGATYPLYALDKEGGVVHVDSPGGKRSPVIKGFGYFPQYSEFMKIQGFLDKTEAKFGMTSVGRLDLDGAGTPANGVPFTMPTRNREAT